MAKDVLRSVREYERERGDEVALEAYLDRLIGWETLHGDAREEHVAAKIQAWRAAMKPALKATVELIRTLHGERPVAVHAGIYDAKGAGMKTEFALRLLELGVHPIRAALLRNDAKISDVTLQSRAQKAELRHRADALRREVDRAAKRIRAIFQQKSPDANT